MVARDGVVAVARDAFETVDDRCGGEGSCGRLVSADCFADRTPSRQNIPEPVDKMPLDLKIPSWRDVQSYRDRRVVNVTRIFQLMLRPPSIRVVPLLVFKVR